jgi:hypothetical protein
MANDNWVGFAKSPKPDPSLSRLRLERAIVFSVTEENAFKLVTAAAGLTTWLHKTEKTDVRTSGKIFLADVAEKSQRAVFSLVEVGRRVVINSELFGEIEIKIDGKQSKLSISFTKMVGDDVRAADQAIFESCLERLALQLVVEK